MAKTECFHSTYVPTRLYGSGICSFENNLQLQLQYGVEVYLSNVKEQDFTDEFYKASLNQVKLDYEK